MFIRRDLEWLDGFPLLDTSGNACAWMSLVPRQETTHWTLDRDLIRRSIRTLNLLRREFPNALPRLVGDVERWTQDRRALIELAKAAVHAGEALTKSPIAAHPYAPPSLVTQVERAQRREPSLKSLITAFEWHSWTTLDELSANLKWVLRHADALHVLREKIILRNARQKKRRKNPQHTEEPINWIELALRLRQLCVAHREARVLPLMMLLGDELIWDFPLELEVDFVNRWIRVLGSLRSKKKKAKRASFEESYERPEATLAPSLARYTLRLATLDQRTQRRGLELLSILVDAETSAWGAWWTQFEDTLQDGFDAATQTDQRRSSWKQQNEVSEAVNTSLRQQRGATPLPMGAKPLLNVLHTAALPTHEAFFRTIKAQLSKWPSAIDHAEIRLTLCVRWLQIFEDSERKRGLLLHIIKRLTETMAAFDFTPNVVKPWVLPWNKKFRHSLTVVDENLIDELSRGQVDTFFSTYEELLLDTRALRMPAGDVDRLLDLCMTFPKAQVAPVAKVLQQSKEKKMPSFFARSTLELAALLLRDRTDNADGVLAALAEVDERFESSAPALRRLIEHFDAAGRFDAIGILMEAGRTAALVHAAFKLDMVRLRRGNIPSIYQAIDQGHLDESFLDSEWTRLLPPEIQKALVALVDADPLAENTAKKLLARDFPTQQSTRKELASLEKIEAPSKPQLRRIKALRERLSAPKMPSKKRIKKLVEKIERAAPRRAFDEWTERLDEEYAKAVADFLGTPSVPTWAFDPKVAEAVMPIGKLEPKVQETARRVLLKRANDPPWDLRNAPKNQAFLTKLKARGFNLEPWLGTFESTAKTTDNKPLTLSLETDPLEVFHMGGHFGTCLTPGAFNYFSVFANVADVNKRVMYARDADGRVFGRQLITLTDDGGVLPFHPYAHSQSVGFRDIAESYVESLAEAMGTVLVASGNVSTLVAPDWYDDGPVDFAKPLPALRDDSAFRKALVTMPPEQVMSEADSALQPLGLSDMTLLQLLELPEIQARPELALAFVPLARRSRLPFWASIKLARTALDESEGSRDLDAWVYDLGMKHARNYEGYSKEAASLLLPHDPALALRLLRKTRPKGIRRWKDDWDGGRIVLAAKANERLHRKNRALELYNLALKHRLDSASRRECKKALKRLQKS